MGWTKSECVACGSSVTEYTCNATGKMGYKCFDCGVNGHLSFDHPLIQNGLWLAVVQCPSCGTTDVWGGNIHEISGIASGSIRYET